MTDSRGSSGEMGDPNSGSAASAPIEAWSEWLRKNMDATSATGATASDPLMSAMQKLADANPMSNIIPLDWMEISQSLQTLWKREMSDPQRAMKVTADYNRRLFETNMKVWNDAASRFWGLPRQEAEEQGKPDKRFSEPGWSENPYYETLKETYLLASEYLLEEAEETGDGQDDQERQRLKFHLKQFVDAMAPVNFLLTNPAALKRITETGGMSLVDGARNLASDMKEGRLSMVDANAFEVGENLAATPGKVVYRNELIELIQYEPTTEQVHEVPLLFFPPWINKYYILDLSQKNSMVKYLVDQGFTVFMTSWKNPDSSMAETKFEDYMELAPLKSVDVIREITGSEKVNPIGYCIGGALLVMTLAWLAAGDDEEKQKFGDPTFMVSLQDYSEVGSTETFMDEPQFEAMEMQMMERGYLDDRKVANMFNLLRSSDLIWANVINNYLLGQKPPALDMLYWNSDGARMARDAHSFYIRNTYLENNLIEPDKVELMGRPIDLGRITSDVYAVGAEKDHIVPWKAAWKISKVLANTNSTRFTLAASGHIAGMISPPEKSRGYWTGEVGQYYETAEQWREHAEEHEGSWWEDWRGWLEQRSGEQTDAPLMGSDQYPPIEDAPGTYVREMREDDGDREGAQLTQDAPQEGPRKKAWDEADHRRNFEGRFGPGEEWEESAHTRDDGGQFT
jgi:polyhydroxyalkanoate synthase